MPLLSRERLLRIIEEVEAVQLDKPIIMMTIGEFIEVMDEDYYRRFLTEEFAFVAFGKIKQLKLELEAINNLLRKYEVKISGDERAAMAGVEFPTPQERMLIDAREWFGLQCLESDGGRYGATSVPLAEYIIMLKEKTAAAQFERNRAKIEEKKMKGSRR